MLAVRRIEQEQLDTLGWLDDRVLTGDEILLRISHTGFTIKYLGSEQRATWRTYPPDVDTQPEKVLQNPDGAVFAAYEDDTFIGIVCMRCTAQKWCEVLDLRVDASHRRSGVATMLLDSCVRLAQGRGMKGLRIMASEANPVLCQFCEHTGFVLSGYDHMALIHTESECNKPMMARASALYFYRLFDKE